MTYCSHYFDLPLKTAIFNKMDVDKKIGPINARQDGARVV